MTAYVALLRAVNVGGTGKLPMSDLRAMGEACGFDAVATYIASGNLLLRSDDDERGVKQALGGAVARFSRPYSVLVRTADQLLATAAANPFEDESGSGVIVVFLDTPATADDLIARNQTNERIASRGREVFVAYGAGMRESKLYLRAFRRGTGRNANTVAKLAHLAVTSS